MTTTAKQETLEVFMRDNDIRRIERHEPTDELPYEWFAVELMDGFLADHIGTDRRIEGALAKAVQSTCGRKAA